MNSINVEYSRKLLFVARENLKKTLSTSEYRELMRRWWIYRYQKGETELHIQKCDKFPDGYFENIGYSDNLYHAKAKGLQRIYELLFSENENVKRRRQKNSRLDERVS